MENEINKEWEDIIGKILRMLEKTVKNNNITRSQKEQVSEEIIKIIKERRICNVES